MPNPYGITEVDIPALLAGYENQRVRRFEQLRLAHQDRREEQEFQRKQGILQIMSRVHAPGSAPASGGMGAAYSQPAAPTTATAPLTAPTMPAGAPPAPPGTVTATSTPPGPAGAPAASQPPETWMAANRDLISQLMTVDAPQAFQLVQHFQSMDANQVKQVQEHAKIVAVASQSLKAVPLAGRAAALQQWVPDLLRQGVSQEEITAAAADLSDAALDRHVAEGRDIEQIIDDTRTKWMPVGEGGAIRVDAYGNPTGAGNPYASGYVPPSGEQASTSAPSAPARSGGPFKVNGVPGDRETSGRRSARHNAEVGGVPNSYHISGQASDRVPPAGMSMAAFHAELQRRNPDLEVINEGDHVHLEPRGHRASGQHARVANDADYAALPSGATFVAPDGSTRRKP